MQLHMLMKQTGLGSHSSSSTQTHAVVKQMPLGHITDTESPLIDDSKHGSSLSGEAAIAFPAA